MGNLACGGFFPGQCVYVRMTWIFLWCLYDLSSILFDFQCKFIVLIVIIFKRWKSSIKTWFWKHYRVIYRQYLVVAQAFWFCEHGIYQTSFKTIFVTIYSYKSTLNTADHRPGEGRLYTKLLCKSLYNSHCWQEFLNCCPAIFSRIFHIINTSYW